MDYKDIICYDSVNGNNNTVPLRELPYVEGKTLTDVFYAVHDATDCEEIISGINKAVAMVFSEEKRNEKSLVLRGENGLFVKVKFNYPSRKTEKNL